MNDPSRFPVIDRHVWLNHAAISPWPAAVIEAMQGFVDHNAQRGPVQYERWLEVEARAHDRAARLLDAEPDDIALIKNTSEGLSLIASGLGWHPGDAVVCVAGDFPSNRLPWHQLVPGHVDVREVPFDPDRPEAGLINALDGRVRLMAVSSVRYDSGVRLDLARLSEACRASGALLAVDAIQHLGAIDLNVSPAGPDFIVAGSHKWLLSPEGLAIFWSRPEARARLKPLQTGWRMWPDPFNFRRDNWAMPTTARRFEPGTLNMAGIHGLDAALGLLLSESGPDRTRALLDRSGALIEALAGIPGVQVETPADPARRAGIVSFRHAAIPAAQILSALADADIHAARRGDSVRLSPHFYTPMDQLNAAVKVIGGLG